MHRGRRVARAREWAHSASAMPTWIKEPCRPAPDFRRENSSGRHVSFAAVPKREPRDVASRRHSTRAPPPPPHRSRDMGSIIGKITEELPKHEVLGKTAAYELRRYAPCVVAETSFASSKGMFGGDQGGSFMRLAKFIGVMAKPQNEQAEPIAMTAPVLMQRDDSRRGADGAYKMAFFLPASRFAKAADAPKPTNPDVTLVDLPARVVAAKTFSGNMRAGLIAEKGAARAPRGAGEGRGQAQAGRGGHGRGVQPTLDPIVPQDERSHARGGAVEEE